MNDATMYGWVSLGVLIAVIFPVLSGFIRKEFPPTAAVGLPPWLKKYGALLIFSLVAALICLAIWKAGNPDKGIEWFTAFLLGFAWESTIEKFQKKG
jgi:hypothetical protein